MVDFKKKLGKKVIERKIHPKDIYQSLDRASDKGPLRLIQEKILEKWFDHFKTQKDVILKMHTGQGKTLTGLLILQSRLNDKTGPALYLCHNNHLLEQTCLQAESFGINYCVITDEIPDEFIDGKSILITSVQKLFNGETKFGLGARSLNVSTVLMDDAHACIEVIKNACKITLLNTTNAYQEILTLFGPELQNQGVGTFADIKRKEYDALLPVPYWDWQDKHTEVAEILSKYSTSKDIKFTWPLIKDDIRNCQCLISGTSLEIIPYTLPLHLFGSYFKASHRIFMSATLTDDSFLIRGLGIDSKSVKAPLQYENEGWSGEKMILIPTLIDPMLDRTEIVNLFAKPKKKNYGVVALVPSFNSTKDWQKYGAMVANKDTIVLEIEKLKSKDYEKTLVIANRYDGIDLPDNACRILVIDSKPFFESLYDRYIEECRSNSDILSVRLAQTIEQGTGRGIRGEKDYCVIIITGAELVRAIRSQEKRKYFSVQTRTQVEIGLEIAEYAKEEINNGTEPIQSLNNLINQSLTRDEGWKEFYKQQMDEMELENPQNEILEVFELEKKAEDYYNNGLYEEAVNTIQNIIDKHVKTEEERGWYLQEMARLIYPLSRDRSNTYQISAHRKNRFLLKPKEGMQISKIPPVSLKRVENIINWIQNYATFEELFIAVEDILSKLRYGVKADRFESALDELAKSLGFPSQRPDKEWKEGPDNLWKITDNQYMLIECKNNVDLERGEINKDETGQMNNACAWFSKNYGEISIKRIMIINTRKVASAAGFNYPVEIMREKHLKKLTDNVKKFFLEFKHLDLKSLSEKKIQELLQTHKLIVDDLVSDLYSETPRI
ncbi:DEAD/DEAH box helicase family protein [Ammoniphilus sp. 3BR4]|uniref:DEAD/DEAH box helicase family protein n=1 Tax=Ammoniphilus sp. 3BR4 TaxID=3158265 RepID=UPI003467BB67